MVLVYNTALDFTSQPTEFSPASRVIHYLGSKVEESTIEL